MGRGLQEKLLWREQNSPSNPNIRSIYGDPYWVHNLDIVNELGGHSGCVNALSWSKSGQFLASGSDDCNVLIHHYQTDGSSKPFKLTTEISTGHTANIFSVKFMPHSNDNTLVSAAGDSEVRVFDVEYSARNQRTSSTAALGSRGGVTYNGIRHLTEGDSHARVYRSHADRVKRIVTESSPFLFLTCSEDGEVRQWDLRLPSSAYPEPRSGRDRHRISDERNRGNVPPPLISYRRYKLDLNTISCSPNHPPYIALGGAHLHCFLHDRRMIGRDVASERGSDSSFSIDTDFYGDMMGKATRCVRRFAPNGKQKMGRFSDGHITACKISDANPNEMVVSWSGGHVYSFDLLRSPDAQDEQDIQKSRNMSLRKRKRVPAASQGENVSKQRRSRSASEETNEVALRVRYGNGQSEDITLDANLPGSAVEEARQTMLTPSERQSLRIARSVVKIRRLLFSLEKSTLTEESRSVISEDHLDSLKQAVTLALKTLKDMDKVIKSWRYPIGPVPEEIAFQNTLRGQRDRARRFVQAAGTIAKLLSETDGEAVSEDNASKFDEISYPTTEGPLDDTREIFRYDFLKAILSWLKGGAGALLSAFRKDSKPTRQPYRFPIPEGAGIPAINRYLVRHLLLLASENPVPDLERSRFEHDETRQLFETERYAVTAFAHIVEISAEAENGSEAPIDSSGTVSQEVAAKARLYDSSTTRKFWGFKVARGLLMKAAEGVDFAYVDRAFGGLGRGHRIDAGRNQTDINFEEEDPEIEGAALVRHSRSEARASPTERSVRRRLATVEDVEDSDEEALLLLSHLRDEMLHDISDEDSQRDLGDSDMREIMSEYSSDEDEQGEQGHDEDFDSIEDDEDDDNHDYDRDHDNDGNDGRDDDDDDDDDDESGAPWGRRRFLWSSSAERARLRQSVDADVPVNSHTRIYRGHCNVKTVKDVNFYGLNDEYVVSGSDSGHVFIWDRKTQKLLNILEGDSDIVNVIQGHPYEPMLAVSGIDRTIKIFSADNRAQRDARLGLNLAATQRQSENNYTTIGRRRFARPPRRADPTQESLLPAPNGPAREGQRAADKDRGESSATRVDSETDEEDAPLADDLAMPIADRVGLTSRRRMHDSYTIVSQNDVDREGGMHDAYITRGMLAQLAMQMRAHGAAPVAAGEEEDAELGGGNTIVIDDNCSVM